MNENKDEVTPKETPKVIPKATNIKSLEKDFKEFKDEVKEQNDKVLGLLEKVINKDPEPSIIPEIKEDSTPDISDLNEKQDSIFKHYFDPVDGFKAWYDVNNNIFTIEVPMSLSNTTPAYQTLYKQDLRSKKVDQNNILGSMKAWCELVASNLKYERRIRLK